jgi:hypothetical protein
MLAAILTESDREWQENILDHLQCQRLPNIDHLAQMGSGHQ